MPNLLPKPSDHLSQLFNTTLSWPERKQAAFDDPCPAANTWFASGVDRISGLIQDYVVFVAGAQKRFGSPMPRFAVQWNVNAGWEWSDTMCLDALEMQLSPADFQHAVLYLTAPCHRDTVYLQSLVNALCGSGHCPSSINHDVDFIYNTAYALDVLRRNKAMLAASGTGVAFAININDPCNGVLDCIVTVTSDGQRLQLSTRAGMSPNLLQEMSLTTLVSFLRAQDVLDARTVLRVQSWTVRPIEQGAHVAESIPGSFAHTASAILF